MRGGRGVVEQVFAEEEITRVEKERRGLDMEGGPTQPHHPECQRMRRLTATAHSSTCSSSSAAVAVSVTESINHHATTTAPPPSKE